jgi:SAM-dependent methyltransferase
MGRIRQVAASVFFHAGRTADRAARLSHYLAAGTFQLADMRESIRDSWQDFYSSDPPRTPLLLPWEQALYERFVPADSQLLVIGCGSGRDLVALAQRGHQVTGIEPSDAAVREARRMLLERSLSGSVAEGFFEDATVSGEFEAVIFSYYCYAAIPVSRRRIEALKKAARLLAPGGHIVVSYAANTSRPRAFLIHLAQLSGRLFGSDWRLEDGDVVWDNRTIQPSYSYTHAFQPGELEYEAAAAHVKPVFCETTPDQSVVMVLGLA